MRPATHGPAAPSRNEAACFKETQRRLPDRLMAIARKSPLGEEVRAAISEMRPRVGELARTAGDLRRWSAKITPARLAGAVAFLRGQLLPLLEAEEEVVYPALEAALGVRGVMAMMTADHADLARRADALGALVGRLGRRPPSPSEVEALQAGLYGLWAVASLHLSKEEAVLLPLAETRLSAASLARLFQDALAGARRAGEKAAELSSSLTVPTM